ncbi:hypothetical protein, variant [Verruconis gallopava]|uniref:t-SNARE coiled-coil homology domain-containing protein n=1 Tax=Verruconis gallopava TaxID=253628 RepID=A0A0D2AR24_9PEZI|nr:uncharacterized protein PV09_06835 [Verruconis gallopava]XP_016211519.1 hypothetical protein, variant [Verruconis gallopava]KIW01649.1 hypothetical protein PV09_06835 [Verruconis gallopava]KIW01650.1 hypothetical protein, variant [Verruconis gallopava]
MTSRYGNHLTNRGLFAGYDDQKRPASRSPHRPASGYGNRYAAATPDNSAYTTYEPSGSTFSAYPTSNGTAGTPSSGFKNSMSRGSGALSMAELEHMESQSDAQTSNLLEKVGMLKSLTLKIGDEIRDSANLADSMNEGFSATSVRLKGTMTRMLRMAESTGVGWRAWLGFFAAVVLLFWYVWLF